MKYLNCTNNLLRTRHLDRKVRNERNLKFICVSFYWTSEVWTKCRNGIIANVSRINEKFSDTWSHTRILKIILKQKYFILPYLKVYRICINAMSIVYVINYFFLQYCSLSFNTSALFLYFPNFYFHDCKLHVLNVFKQSTRWFISEL